MVALRRLIASVDNGTWGSEPAGTADDVLCIRAADFDFGRLTVDLGRAPMRAVDRKSFNRLALRPGDLVLEKSGGGENAPVGRAVIFEHQVPAVTSNFAARVRPELGVDARFLTYLLRSLYDSGRTLECIKQTTGIQNLDTEHWLTTPVTKPDLGEQRRIADFLDHRFARIDQIIATRSSQLMLLDQMLIEDMRSAVAGVYGSHDGVSDFRLPWVSRVSREAVILPLARVLTLQRGVDLTEEDRRPGSVPVVTTAGPVGMHDTSIEFGPGVVIGRYGTVGNVHWVDGPYWPHNTTLYVKDSRGNDLRWLYYLLRTFPYGAMQARAAVPGVNRNDMATELVAWIPHGLQTASARWMDERVLEHSVQRSALTGIIDRLNEYKRSLITAAVTGQIDRTAAGSVIEYE